MKRSFGATDHRQGSCSAALVAFASILMIVPAAAGERW